MLELSISLKEIIFTLFSLGVIAFSFLAILSNSTRSSIINFLLACVFVCGFIIFVSETIIAITLAIIYVSMSSLFLIMTDDHCISQNKIGKTIIALVLLIFLVSILIYKNGSVQFIAETNNSNYIGIGEITLITSLIFLFVLSGLISIFTPSEK